MIVPRSSTLINQDQDFALFNVTLFKKVVEEFKLHAREKKFVVREFTYNEEEMAAGKNEITKLVTDKKKQFVSLAKLNRFKERILSLYFILLLTGSSCQMVEGELQRNFLCLGAREGLARLRRIGLEVIIKENSPNLLLWIITV